MSDDQQHGGFGSDTLNLLSMLHLNSSISTATNHHPLPAATSPPAVAANSSKKRRSPASVSSRSKKLRAKRIALFPPATTAAAAKTTLSSSTSPGPPPPSPLQRSLSEPINITELTQVTDFSNSHLFGSLASASAHLLKNISPENSKNCEPFVKSSPPAANPSLPPLPPPLRRSSSDPIPAHYLTSAINSLQRPPTPATTSSSSDQESPSSTRLKKIKEKMQEMSEWCQEIERLDNKDETASENECGKIANDEFEKRSEEAVMVDNESIDGGLVIHFKCPCGKGYEVLLSGNSCYYKLIAFH